MTGRRYIASEFDTKLGHAIFIQRQMHGLSQKDLARRLGITHQQVQKYESGNNRMAARTLYQIAEFFEISVDKLIYNATNEFTNDKTIHQTMDLMYTKMNDTQRRLLLTIASYIAG